MRTRTIIVFAAVTAVVFVGCGTAADRSSETRSPSASTTPAPDAMAAGTLTAQAVVPEVAVFAAPDGSEAPERVVPGVTAFDFPQSFLVLDESGDFLHVVVPGRPNGATGWVQRSDVDVSRVDHELRVDLGARTLTWLHDGQVRFETTAAIGSEEFPTPTGAFFVTDVLDSPDDGPYGNFAIGLSGRSVQLTDFAGGDGQIGIHGTNDPSSIGLAVSHGCVRVPNDVITQLATSLPLGTPVTIV